MSLHRNPTLISVNNPGYRRFLRALYNQRKREQLGPRQPPSAGSQLGRILEEEACRLLGVHAELSERRILCVEKRERRGIYVLRYKEIDAVVLSPAGQPVLFVEIKMRSSVFRALKAAYPQLKQIKQWSGERWPGCRHAVVVLLPDEPRIPLDKNEQPMVTDYPVVALDGLQALARCDWPAEQTGFVTLQRSALWAQLVREERVEDPDLLKRARAESEAARSPEAAVVAAAEAPAGPSAFGAALLDALKR